MADFNVKVDNVENGSGFVGASRGASAPTQQRFVESGGTVANISDSIRTKVNSTATLIEQVGSIYGTVVAGVDSLIKSNINESATAQTDQIFNEFGVDDTTTIKGSSIDKEPTPIEIDKAAKNLERLTQAQRRGTVDENSYWTRMETVARQLRARYPGHRDYIDQRISGIAGGKPANQIVSNLMAQAAKGGTAAQEEARNRREYIQKLTVAGMHRPNLEQMTYSELLAYSGPLYAKREQLNQNKQQLDVLSAGNKATGEMVAKEAQSNVQLEMAMMFQDVASPVAKEYKQLVSQVVELSKTNTPIEPAQQEQLRATFGTIRSTMLAKLQADTVTKYGTLTKEQRNEVIAPAVEFMAQLEDQLVNKNYGLFSRTLNRLEAYKSGDIKNLIESETKLRKVRALTELLGPQNTSLVLQNNVELRTSLDRILLDDSLTDTMVDGDSVSVAIKRASRNEDMDPKLPRKLLNITTAVISNPQSSKEAVKAAANSLYGAANNDFLGSGVVPVNEQPAVYTRMVNEQTYARLKEAGGEGVDNYRNWAKTNFLNVFKSYAEDLKQVDPSVISFDAKSGQFITAPESVVVGGRGGADGVAAGRNASIRGAQSTVAVLNTGLRSLMPVLKDTNQDAQAFIAQAYPGLVALPGKMRLQGTMVDNVGFTTEGITAQVPTDALVKTFKPGEKDRGVKQLTPQEGDSVQLDEISNLITRKQQDLRLFYDLQKDGDPEAIDAVDRTTQELMDLIKERNSLQDAWIKQFQRKKDKPTS